MSIIELNGVSYKRGTKKILNDINIRINEGERWAVLGKNGSGKTTLASILAGYRGNYDGSVKIWNEKLNDHNVINLRKKIGFVSESYFSNCYNRELGLEIILGGVCGQLGEQHGIIDSDVLRAKKLLKAFGIKEKGLYPYDLLSKGQQQLVLLSRAFMSPKELLVMDEPCTGLDIFGRQLLSNSLTELSNKSKVTLFYITHHTEEITSVFDHALLLDSGCVHSGGDIKDVLSDKNLSDFFNCDTKTVWDHGYLNLKVQKNYKIDSSLMNSLLVV